MTPEALDQIGIVLREGKEADRLKAAGIILAYGWGRAPLDRRLKPWRQSRCEPVRPGEKAGDYRCGP